MLSCCLKPIASRVVRLLTQSTRGSGVVGSGQKIYRKGRLGSGRAKFDQRLKFNFKVLWYLYFILHFSLHNAPAVYSVSPV